MTPTYPDRHTTLVAAGWIYDAAQDRYRAPGSAATTATWYNLGAAWRAFQAAHNQHVRIRQRPADPRRSEPL